MSAATVYVNFDFELGWGVIDNGRWREREALGVYRRLHDLFPTLLGMLSAHEVAVDWATVGALMTGPEDVPTDHLPLDYAVKVAAFSAEAEPCTKDGRTLMDGLVGSGQTLVSHSLTHVVLDRADVDEPCLSAELAITRRLLRERGYDGGQLVFPENRACSDESLMRVDVRSVRAPANHSDGRVRRFVQKVYRPPVACWSGSGVRRLSGSMLFQPRSGRTADRALFAIQRRGLLDALARGEDMCIWLHPFNFGLYPTLYDDFAAFIATIASRRDAGHLRIGSLTDV